MNSVKTVQSAVKKHSRETEDIKITSGEVSCVAFAFPSAVLVLNMAHWGSVGLCIATSCSAHVGGQKPTLGQGGLTASRSQNPHRCQQLVGFLEIPSGSARN